MSRFEHQHYYTPPHLNKDWRGVQNDAIIPSQRFDRPDGAANSIGQKRNRDQSPQLHWGQIDPGLRFMLAAMAIYAQMGCTPGPDPRFVQPSTPTLEAASPTPQPQIIEATPVPQIEPTLAPTWTPTTAEVLIPTPPPIATPYVESAPQPEFVLPPIPSFIHEQMLVEANIENINTNAANWRAATVSLWATGETDSNGLTQVSTGSGSIISLGTDENGRNKYGILSIEHVVDALRAKISPPYAYIPGLNHIENQGIVELDITRFQPVGPAEDSGQLYEISERGNELIQEAVNQGLLAPLVIADNDLLQGSEIAVQREDTGYTTKGYKIAGNGYTGELYAQSDAYSGGAICQKRSGHAAQGINAEGNPDGRIYGLVSGGPQATVEVYTDGVLTVQPNYVYINGEWVQPPGIDLVKGPTRRDEYCSQLVLFTTLN